MCLVNVNTNSLSLCACVLYTPPCGHVGTAYEFHIPTRVIYIVWFVRLGVVTWVDVNADSLCSLLWRHWRCHVVWRSFFVVGKGHWVLPSLTPFSSHSNPLRPDVTTFVATHDPTLSPPTFPFYPTPTSTQQRTTTGPRHVFEGCSRIHITLRQPWTLPLIRHTDKLTKCQRAPYRVSPLCGDSGYRRVDL